jgi:hypothetical protein
MPQGGRSNQLGQKPTPESPYDWGGEKPELQRLYAEVLRTVDSERQQALIQ